MTRRRLAIALAVPVVAFAPLFAQTTTSVWTGVYTTGQAARGTDLYQRVCSECHGDDLEGRERSPALAGSSFAQRWDGRTFIGTLTTKTLVIAGEAECTAMRPANAWRCFAPTTR